MRNIARNRIVRNRIKRDRVINNRRMMTEHIPEFVWQMRIETKRAENAGVLGWARELFS